MRSAIKSLLAATGIEVRLVRNIRKHLESEKSKRHLERWRLLTRHNPKTVLDIGANDGYSVAIFRDLFPAARILSFEPLQDCFLKVDEVIRKHPPGQAFHCALGDTDGTAKINRSEFSPSSSLLPMGELHKREYPFSAKSTPERIVVRSLDGMRDDLRIEYPMIAKIDVQGFENRVIRGGEQTLRQASAIIVELSAYPLYLEQASFSEVNGLLESMGFIFRGTIDQAYSR